MPGENSQSNQQNQNQSPNQGDNSNNNADQGKGSQDQSDQGSKTVPYDRFAEVNSKYKTANQELEKFREKERLENENKLKEEKKFQELIGTKDETIKNLTSKINQIETERKVDNLKSKVSNVLSKNNVIDAEDGLKFVKYDDLIDSDDAENEINKRVGELVKSKAYLFKTQGNQSNGRSKTENNIPGSQQKPGDGNNGAGKKLSVTEKLTQSLAEKFKTT